MAQRSTEGKPGLLRITNIRILTQAFFFVLFAGLLTFNTFATIDQHPRFLHWVSKLLEIDPLISVSTALATHTIYSGLAWSLVLVVGTLLLGRFFCGWICPFGALHQFVGWLLGPRAARNRINANRYRPLYTLKYYILAAMLISAAFGSLQIGLLDPIAFIHRSFTVSVAPTVTMPLQKWLGDYRIHQWALLIGAIFVGFVALNAFVPRFFCRAVCPLGALLGLLSRFSLWRVYRDPDRCTDCGLCLRHCQGASDPHEKVRKSECMVCFNCVESCPQGAIRFAFMPPRTGEVTDADLSRRRLIFAGFAGLVFFPLARASGRTTEDFSSSVVRPPGSVEELEFLKRCIKCGQCIRVCPTNVLQPAMFEAGIEGMWTPIMNFRIGFCQLNCTACGQVCPTGAIQRITVEEKLGLGKYAEQGPVRLGTAHYDLGRCLPWSKNIPCVVCEEVCPTSPKAIFTEWRKMLIRNGKKQIIAATANTATLAEFPKAGGTAARTVLRPNELRGDESRRFYLKVMHADGTEETHRIVANTVDTVQIEGHFRSRPQAGEVAALLIELKVPKIDVTRCIGCGLCEHECPVVGNRRAVYVTAEGESRSQNYADRRRNRSVRLIKTS